MTRVGHVHGPHPPSVERHQSQHSFQRFFFAEFASILCIGSDIFFGAHFEGIGARNFSQKVFPPSCKNRLDHHQPPRYRAVRRSNCSETTSPCFQMLMESIEAIAESAQPAQAEAHSPTGTSCPPAVLTETTNSSLCAPPEPSIATRHRWKCVATASDIDCSNRHEAGVA